MKEAYANRGTCRMGMGVNRARMGLRVLNPSPILNVLRERLPHTREAIILEMVPARFIEATR